MSSIMVWSLALRPLFDAAHQKLAKRLAEAKRYALFLMLRIKNSRNA
jgi:hypothetical protein